MTSHLFDTIAATATPVGEGGIGIVRISGADAEKIAHTLFKPYNKPRTFASHHLYFGTIVNPADNASLDTALMAIMKKPKSFTGETVVEFHCHGGQLVLQRVLEVISRQGARLAAPGEFTKRAFLNGRMDLAQAEAVIDLIRAKTDLSLRVAYSQLEGRLSGKINVIKEDIVNLLVHIEAELDFSDEEDVGSMPDADIGGRLKKAGSEIQKLLSTYEEGRILKEGVNCIILGRPNVGKSSLLNLLLKEERAIVTPVPGTTRDVIEEVVNIKGIPLRLMDTAGLRETREEVESIGIKFSMKRLESSHMVLFVVDISAGEFKEDIRIMENIVNKLNLFLINITDPAVGLRHDQSTSPFEGMTKVEISALMDKGIEELRQTIYCEAAGQRFDEFAETVISSARHKFPLKTSNQFCGE